MKKIILFVYLLVGVSQALHAQDFDFIAPSFEGDFEIDSTLTRDGGKSYEVSASGMAGEYGRVNLSYVFTDKLELGDAGEFTAFAWTQNGDEVVTATLQGTYVKQGPIFKIFSIDLTSERRMNLVTGIANFVERTMKFEVREFSTD